MKWKLLLIIAFTPLVLYAGGKDCVDSIVRREAPRKDAARTGNFGYNGFSGGMCLLTGYLTSGEFQVMDLNNQLLGTYKASGVPKGIGGAVRFLFGKHLRVGSEGYVTNLSYNGNGSYCTTGWGGILADYYHDVGPVALFAGLDFGAGGYKNILVTGDSRNEGPQVTPDILYEKFPLLVMAPYIGTEIKIKESFRILLKADYMVNLLSRSKPFTEGVRVYVGFVFARFK